MAVAASDRIAALAAFIPEITSVRCGSQMKSLLGLLPRGVRRPIPIVQAAGEILLYLLAVGQTTQTLVAHGLPRTGRALCSRPWGFSSGQRGRTQNPLETPREVRILHAPLASKARSLFYPKSVGMARLW